MVHILNNYETIIDYYIMKIIIQKLAIKFVVCITILLLTNSVTLSEIKLLNNNPILDSPVHNLIEGIYNKTKNL